MKLIVGLGNPGKEYENTRHNVGFMILDKFLSDEKWKEKFNGLYVEKNIDGEKYIFLKPLSYMNLSGGVVKKYLNYFDIDSKDLLVIQDDLDLPTGKLKIKKDSSSGGHNGIKDIISAVGNNNFVRIKIGVANNKEMDTKDYVLGNFSKSDKELIMNNFDTVIDIIKSFDYSNIELLMNKYN